jgi:hypothetical protein
LARFMIIESEILHLELQTGLSFALAIVQIPVVQCVTHGVHKFEEDSAAG